jgi:amidase
MTRTIADAALMQSVTAGPHALDHDSLRERVQLPSAAGDLQGFRIAWSADFDYVPIDPEVRRNLHAALDVFRGLGCIVEEVKLGWTYDVDRSALHWYNTMHFGRQTVWHKRDNGVLMTDYALKLAAAIETSTGIDDVHKAWEVGHRMYQTLGPVLDSHDVFICPTLTVPAVKAEHDPWDQNFTVNGVKVDPEYGWVMTHQFNMLHNCPVLAVPSGFAGNGVPTGIQIVGKTFDDATVFRAGLAYERALGGWFTDASKRPAL